MKMQSRRSVFMNGPAALRAGARQQSIAVAGHQAGGDAQARLTLALLAGVTPISPSNDKTGATDTHNIQAALTASGSTPVVLASGTFYLNAPLRMTAGNSLIGFGGPVQGGGGSLPSSPSTAPGTILTFGSDTWSSSGMPAGAPSGVIAMVSAGPQNRMSVSDLWINGYKGVSQYQSSVTSGIHAPAGVHGIAAWGGQNSVSLVNVGPCYMGGQGVGAYEDSGTPADGWYFLNCLIQGNAQGGIYGYLSDATLVDVHAQGNYISQGDGTVGIWLLSANARLIGVRSDTNGGDGFQISAPNATGALQGVTLTGCGTQRNSGNGLNVENLSGTGVGPPMYAPVSVIGCMFDGDGRGALGSSGYTGGADVGGIRVSGQVMLTVTASFVLGCTQDVSGAGCPQYGFLLGDAGSDSGVPALVSFDSCFLNCANASAYYLNNTTTGGPHFSNVYGVKGGQWDGVTTPASL
jgi:hypothetical protein